MKYLLFLPERYNNNTGKKWPLIMYLHGGSRRGTDIEKLREPGYGLPALVEKNKSFPFVVLSPKARRESIGRTPTALSHCSMRC
jgi:predicted peptidase